MAHLAAPIVETDHIAGNNAASLTLVEYGDFQCPHCGMAEPVLKEVREIMGDKMRFVFRHFPLNQVHQFAELAAEASEAANAQGKFWEMHDLLLERQEELNEQTVLDIASSLGLNVAQFEQSLVSREFQGRVHHDFLTGVKSGVNGTPSIFINEKKYEEDVTVEDIMQALEGIQRAGNW